MLEHCCKNILYVVLDLHQCQFSSCGWILRNKECLYRSVNTLLALMSTPQHTNWLLNISRKCSHPTRRSASCKATSGNVLFNLPPAIATLYQIDIASNTGQAGAASEPENLHCSIFSLLSMQEYAAAAAAGAREYAAGWREWHTAGSWHLLYAGEHHIDMCCAIMTVVSARFHTVHKSLASFAIAS